ncbi:MAG: nickel-binding protein [Ginsengibacter sp.]
MPIYLDLHIVNGLKAREAAQAHNLDLLHQEQYGCKSMTYWVDEEREKVFCLIDAPDREAVKELHRVSHGMVPNRIIEVDKSIVNSFLGRIFDPEPVEISAEGLKIFTSPSFRILLVTSCTDPYLLTYRLGMEKANKLLDSHNNIIRKNLREHGGTEAENEGSGFIISFSSAAKAVACALAIQQEMQDAHSDALRFTIAINAGDPVEKSNQLFGDTIHLANNLCFIAGNFQIAIAS